MCRVSDPLVQGRRLQALAPAGGRLCADDISIAALAVAIAQGLQQRLLVVNQRLARVAARHCHKSQRCLPCKAEGRGSGRAHSADGGRGVLGRGLRCRGGVVEERRQGLLIEGLCFIDGRCLGATPGSGRRLHHSGRSGGPRRRPRQPQRHHIARVQAHGQLLGVPADHNHTMQLWVPVFELLPKGSDLKNEWSVGRTDDLAVPEGLPYWHLVL
mmetsp:Transcript_10610/g.29938  ORF Transcript_10610/g.29938 Transcript_10610/m.29938 type:complete len:214 (-) Transcript_10610:1089-1730(-)